MLTFQNIFLLSIIQGLTEFLPVSSSAHLIMIPKISGNPDQGRIFDVAVHSGSFIAVILYLWKDIVNMLIGIFSLGSKNSKDFRLFYVTVFASLPLCIVGYYLQNSNFGFLRSLELIAWSTLIFGIALYVFDNSFLKIKKIEDLNIVNGLIIGLFQILAFLPGASRSGVSITAGRILGFDRIAAAKFSLFLSIPAILGATTLEFYDLIQLDNYELNLNILNAMVLSFVFSMISIHFMMKWISNYTFTPFVVYRVLLGTILLLAIYFW